MSFDDMPPETPTTGAGETRAFPKLTFEDMPKPASPPPSQTSPWDEPAPSTGGETRGFPEMSFNDFQKSEPAPPPPPLPTSEAAAWDSRPAGNFDSSDTTPAAPPP